MFVWLCSRNEYHSIQVGTRINASHRAVPLYRAGLVVSIFVTLFGGCSGLPFPSSPDVAPSPREHDIRIDRALTAEGLRLLDQHRYQEASRVFNAGLKFAPTNAQLHFFNGLTYHLLYLAGDEGALGLGIAGYELALTNDPAHYYAALQLGRLQFEAKRFGESLLAFRRATEIDPRSGDAYLGLASAAYYAHDPTSARAAAAMAASLLPGSAEALRALAMTNAAVGNQEQAKEASARYAALERNPKVLAKLNARLDQWRAWYMAAGSSETQGQAVPEMTSQTKATGNSKADSAKGSAPPAAAIPNGSARRAWFECQGRSEDQASSQFGPATSPPAYGSGGLSGSENSIGPAPALPSPCQGAGSPPMVVLDVAFIRTENASSSSHGINLLRTLTYTFGINRTVRDVATQNVGTREITITRTRQRGTGTAVDSLITYSLNIANATDNRSEVLAKPTLIALDRIPSVFFSGRNITLGIAGQLGGSSLVTDRPVGVGLAVTPTFIDSETVALAIRLQRSFIEELDLNVNFSQSLQASRNAVSANVVLKMGQTLILSGLSEQETQRSSSGVPILKDIPLLQYLFNKTTMQNFTSSVLVLITPRAPMMDSDVMSRTLSHIDSLADPEKRKYRPLIEKAMKATPGEAPSNIEGAYRHAYGNTLFLQFRSGDLALKHWSSPSRLDEFFRNLREMLYY